MARQNIAFLYARVSKAPVLTKDNNTGEYNYGMVYVDTVRNLREIEDGLHYVKHEYPLIISREKCIVENMLTWKENDIVIIKGTLNTKKILKSSFCPVCQNDDGTSVKNSSLGNLVYITPIYAKKLRSYDEKEDAIKDIVDNREISNQIYIVGTLLKDPKFFTTTRGVQITQYPVAINRKYIIRADDPDIRTDWPIVKTYGEQARDDKTFLKYQADVIIDGFLQARTVRRKIKCCNCGNIYEWKDNAMEIVGYDVEYVSGYLTKEEVEQNRQTTVEKYKQMLFQSGYKEPIEEDLKSDDLE